MISLKISATGLSHMCRLCLRGEVTLINLFAYSTQLEARIVDVLVNCAPVNVTRSDEFPPFICKLCYAQLEKFHKFRTDAVRSETTLREYLNVLRDIQNEFERSADVQNGRCESSNEEIDTSKEENKPALQIQNENDFVDNLVETKANLTLRNDTETAAGTLMKQIKTNIANDIVENDTLEEEKLSDMPTRNENFVVDNSEEESEVKSKIQYPFATNFKIMHTVFENLRQPLFDNDPNLSSNEAKHKEPQTVNKEGEVKLHEIGRDDVKRIEKSAIESSGTDAKLFLCDVCDKSFGRRRYLTLHKRTHSEDKPFSCETCNKRFNNSSNLIRHKRIHSGEKPYQCSICDRLFQDSSWLKVHMQVHTGVKPYSCTFCNKSFTQQCNLKTHCRTHTGEKPYKCDECDKAFGQQSDLKTHKRTHTGEQPYGCDSCSKRFTQVAHLNAHRRVHTGDKPYQCDACAKRFSHSVDLKRHRYVHTGERPYACDECPAAFSHSSNLARHKQNHSGIKPFQCDVCSKCFGRSSYLKAHQAAVHSRSSAGESAMHRCHVCDKSFVRLNCLKRHEERHFTNTGAYCATSVGPI